MDEPVFQQQAHGYQVKHPQKHNEDYVLVFSLNFDLISTSTENVGLDSRDDGSKKMLE